MFCSFLNLAFMEGKSKHKRDEKTLELLAKRVKQLRKDANMNQRQLAFEATLSRAQIGDIETTKANPTISNLAMIAKAFEIPLYELFNFPEDDAEE